MAGFWGVLAASALAAYAVGSVPITWIGDVLAVVLGVYVLAVRGIRLDGDVARLVVLIAWCVFVTAARAVLADVSPSMPPLATTRYPVFVGLRILELFAFAAEVIVVRDIVLRFGCLRVMKWVVTIGCGVAAAALYIYVAQVYGLPEPPRTRVGTSGLEQSTTFQYAFHRAMGTFREPSHLAEWLAVPFVFSMGVGRRVVSASSVVIGGALLLTGSLTGIVAASVGIAASLVLARPLSISGLHRIARAGAITVCGLLVFDALVVSNTGGSSDIVSVIGSRIEAIVDGGMSGSNRGYIFDYIGRSDLPMIGAGLGNANIDLSLFRARGAVSSFLSLYFYFLFSAGIVGLVVLLIVLGVPLVRLSRLALRTRGEVSLAAYLLAAYVAWLVIFGVHAETFGVMFAVVFGAVAGGREGIARVVPAGTAGRAEALG